MQCQGMCAYGHEHDPENDIHVERLEEGKEAADHNREEELEARLFSHSLVFTRLRLRDLPALRRLIAFLLGRDLGHPLLNLLHNRGEV